MTRLQTLGVALIAVLALAAVAVSSASAATCTTKPCFTGTFPNTYTSSSGAGTLETKSGTKVKCSSDSTEGGEITGEKTGKLKSVVFKGCESSGFKCSTKGAASGEIKTVELETTLGYINKSTKEVGIALKPKGGGDFVTFECTALVKVTVKGAVIGVMTPVNSETMKYTLKFTQTGGKQTPQKFEGGSTDILESEIDGSGKFEESGEQTEDALTLAKTTKLEA